MHEVFQATLPDIVFHAAALKHLPLLEANPLEAWKSNVLGTLNVLQASSAVGVGTFVNISTDKAANPSCVLGYSKRLAERLTADFANRFPGRYVSVRFGNVLGSRGSVVHAFTAQIERGGPITVTHPEVKRYFMLIPEACQLVLQAASIGTDGEVMVLDMGEQVKIVDVAETLIRMSGRRDIEIVYTGLRPGEKLGEELFGDHEDRRSTAHPLVWSVDVPSIGSDAVCFTTQASNREAAEWMRAQTLTSHSMSRTGAE
jgi:dTDP-glucose 4,6-dehydratase